MLVERDHVLTALRELANDAAAGAGRLVFLGGEAGVGKTTLAGALTAEAPDGTVVRRGACDSLTTAEALGPLLDATPEIAGDLGEDSTLRRGAERGEIRADFDPAGVNDMLTSPIIASGLTHRPRPTKPQVEFCVDVVMSWLEQRN